MKVYMTIAYYEDGDDIDIIAKSESTSEKPKALDNLKELKKRYHDPGLIFELMEYEINVK